MPFSFPVSPSVGQQSTQNGRVYQWTGSAWELVAVSNNHTHTSSSITDFNSSVSGLLPVKNIVGSGYATISSLNGNYTVSITGLQPSGNYALSSHTHTSSDITNFNSSVSGLLPVTNITAGTNISISSSSGNFTINSTASDSIHPFLLGGM